MANRKDRINEDSNSVCYPYIDLIWQSLCKRFPQWFHSEGSYRISCNNNQPGFDKYHLHDVFKSKENIHRVNEIVQNRNRINLRYRIIAKQMQCVV